MHHTHAYALLRMAEHDLELGVAGTASSGAEADLMCQRLAEKQQLERAREILAAPSDISEDELATMAEVAPVPVAPPPATDGSTPIPTPKRSVWDRVLGRAGRTSK